MQISHYMELLKYHIGLVVFLFVSIVGSVVAFSVFFLFVSPIYTATAVVSLLPTQTELAFSQTSVRSTSINPANLLSQTHIEYLTSREVARLTVDRLAERSPDAPDVGAATSTGRETTTGPLDQVTQRFRTFRKEFRRIYNTLNSGEHLPVDPYTDAVLQVQDSVEVDMIEGTYILEISAKWGSPEGATAVANVLADVYVERARQEAIKASQELEEELRAELARGEGNFGTLERQINNLRLSRAAQLDFLRVIDVAEPPLYPSFPKVIVNTVFAIVGWVFISIFALIAIDTFSTRVKTNSDARRVFEGRFLNKIHVRRSSKRARAKAAELLRRLSDATPGRGGTMSVGSSRESAGINSFVSQSLNSQGGGKPVTGNNGGPAVNGMRLTQGANETPETANDDGADNVSVLVRHANLAVEEEANQPFPELQPAAETSPQKMPTDLPQTDALRDFGGMSDDFSYANIEDVDWMVVGLRRGKVTEADLQLIVDELKHRGVRHVFGTFLRG